MQSKHDGYDGENKNSVSLPYDVWELVGNYILPESISTFSRICKDSYAVINRPSFWVKLHRDFLPYERLSTRHTKGLKQKIIRYLYLNYLPFSSRLSSPKSKISDPHTLVGLICVNHEWNVTKCDDGVASRRVRFDITFGKKNPPISLWKAGQVCMDQI